MAGFPWPLGGVQAWFEGLWNQVSNAATYAANYLWNKITAGLASTQKFLMNGITWLGGYLWDRVTWLGSQVSNGLNWLWTSLVNSFNTASSLVTNGLTWLWNSISAGISGISTWITNGLNWIASSISSGLNSARSFLMSGINWIGSQVSSGLGNLWTALSTTVSNIGSTVTRGLSDMWSSLTGLAGDLLAGVVEALGSGLQGFFDWILKHLTWLGQMVFGAVNSVIAAVQGFIMDLGQRFMNTLTAVFTPGSPDKELENTMHVMVESMNTRVVDEIKAMYKSPPTLETTLATAGVVATLLGVGILSVKVLASAADAAHPTKDIGFKDIATGMIAGTGAGMMMSSILTSPVQVGLVTPLRHAYNTMFTPEVPGGTDLVRMEAREVWRTEFRPELLKPGPTADFYTYMAMQGFSKFHADSYWAAHWLMMTVSQGYDAYHRLPDFNLEDLKKLMTRLDILPYYHDTLISLAWRLPGAIEARWMYRYGEVAVEDLEDLLVKDGLDPEWAPRVARAVAKNQFRAEITKLTVNAKSDFLKGYILEVQLRADLESLGIPEDWIEYHVSDAVEDRARQHKDSLVGTYEDAWEKDLIKDEATFKTYLATIVVNPEVVAEIVEREYVKKFKKPKAAA